MTPAINLRRMQGRSVRSLTAVSLACAHSIFDDGLTANVSVFVTQSLKYPPSRVTQLAVNLPIALEDLLNDRLKRIHDR